MVIRLHCTVGFLDWALGKPLPDVRERPSGRVSTLCGGIWGEEPCVHAMSNSQRLLDDIREDGSIPMHPCRPNKIDCPECIKKMKEAGL